MDSSGSPDVARLEPRLRALQAELRRERDEARRRARLAEVERLVPSGGAARVFTLSFLATVSSEPRYLQQLHDTIWSGPFTLAHRHFFYWQLITRHAHVPATGTLHPAAVYRSLLAEQAKLLPVERRWIAPAARDADRVIVITGQLLGLQHAPTADCLDYCRVLQAQLGKRVLLVNTASMPWAQPLPYFDPMRFNRLEAYSRIGRLSTRGVETAFYQCRNPMPNGEEVSAILRTVLSERPSFILNLGHSNVAADLCADVVTVATMPFGTNLPRARSNVFVLPRSRRTDDAVFMREWEIADAQVVESEYTFRLPERSATHSRASLGLPDDAYVVAIVGNRLDEEISDEVARELATLLRAGPRLFLAFLGTFPAYPRLAQLDSVFAARSAFLGYQQDVLAVYEHCNAYYNPPRYGGGSSAAFALAMGLPVLTRPGGDVGNIAGPRFHAASADAIAAFLERAQHDEAFARAAAAAARARYAEIADRETMLRRIVADVAARADLRSAPL